MLLVTNDFRCTECSQEAVELYGRRPLQICLVSQLRCSLSVSVNFEFILVLFSLSHSGYCSRSHLAAFQIEPISQTPIIDEIKDPINQSGSSIQVVKTQGSCFIGRNKPTPDSSTGFNTIQPTPFFKNERENRRINHQ